ncbi:hypothetical protein SDRG_12015 [Saprolegnia diclina VS20]|uniref:Uncharacterized protein n=1 Tax=Saprolegnia diclina (strain VS20) TaxID=1156394 RepID=T0RJT2_SAPDV|nr:hypothetical protein SDRG_12015 [Saprolegnia diclina VS20]EQC30162.1 hypothetical protein SDRG_12015 [Saprolegnia diclina VS20]|eukprot:XP_008616294.1 hypothetical protein SDRG_12015 [Saprolegnia diclina VS20]
MVECLLSQPTIDLNAVDDDGNTALMHVAFLHPTAERIWHASLLRSPMAPTSTPATRSRYDASADATPLDVACGEAHVDMVACLLLHPTLDVAKASPTLLWTLCKRGARGLITQLLGHPTTDPMALQPDRYNLLIALCSESHLTEMLSLFLHHPRVDWNASVDDMTPLQRAVEFRHWESVVVLLQDPRVDINATLHDQTLLHAAVLADRVDLVTMLLRHPRIDRRRLMTYQGTAFALAITNESDTFLELFLSIPDDDINVPAHGGATPLHQAITYLSDATTANRLLREPHLRRDAPDAVLMAFSMEP